MDTTPTTDLHLKAVDRVGTHATGWQVSRLQGSAYPARSIKLPISLRLEFDEYPGLSIVVGPNTETGLPIVNINTRDMDPKLNGPDGPYMAVEVNDGEVYDKKPKRFAITQSVTYYVDAEDEAKALEAMEGIQESLPDGVRNVNIEHHTTEQAERLIVVPELADAIDGTNPGEIWNAGSDA